MPRSTSSARGLPAVFFAPVAVALLALACSSASNGKRDARVADPPVAGSGGAVGSGGRAGGAGAGADAAAVGGGGGSAPSADAAPRADVATTPDTGPARDSAASA